MTINKASVGDHLQGWVFVVVLVLVTINNISISAFLGFSVLVRRQLGGRRSKRVEEGGRRRGRAINRHGEDGQGARRGCRQRWW